MSSQKATKSFKVRVAELFKPSAPPAPPAPRRRVAPIERPPLEHMRGMYSLSDSGHFFVPCGDTVRYAVKGTTEAIYLMSERMRFIVPGLKTRAYAVFTASVLNSDAQVLAKNSPASAASTKPPKPSLPAKKAIYVTKVDTLTTTIPGSCRAYSSGTRASGVNPGDGRNQ